MSAPTRSATSQSASGRRVAVLGLGAMGLPMATRLLGAGLSVTAYNRSEGPRTEIARLGGDAVAHVSLAVEPIVLSVLPDITQLREVLRGEDGWLAGLIRARAERDDLGTVRLVVMSTTSPQLVRELADEVVPFGVRVLDAPISGGDRGAQLGTLSIMVGGDPADAADVFPTLAHLGALVEHLGPLGAGSMAKLCNQIVVAGNLTATAEALMVAERSGLDPEVMVRLFKNGLARSGVLELKADKWLSGEYRIGGSAKNQLKDMHYLRDELAQLEVSAPLAETLTEIFEGVIDAGWGEDDHAVVLELLRGARSNYPRGRQRHAAPTDNHLSPLGYVPLDEESGSSV